MKTCRHLSTHGTAAGFSLVEVQVALMLFIIVIGGVMMTYLFGLKLFEHIRPKLDVADQARLLVARFSDDVRTATQIKIGNGTETSFTEFAANKKQNGSAIQVYPTFNTNQFIRYFWDAGDNSVKRWVSTSSNATVLASGVTNDLIFAAQDFAGNILTNNQNNRVIEMELKFHKDSGVRGAANRGDYLIRTRVTRRAIL